MIEARSIKKLPYIIFIPIFFLLPIWTITLPTTERVTFTAWEDHFPYEEGDIWKQMQSRGWYKIENASNLDVLYSYGKLVLSQNGGTGEAWIYIDINKQINRTLYDFAIEMKVRWNGTGDGSYNLGITIDGREDMYRLFLDGHPDVRRWRFFNKYDNQVGNFGVYSPLSDWHTITLNRTGSTFYAFYDQKQKGSYYEEDMPHRPLKTLIIGTGWACASEFDYVKMRYNEVKVIPLDINNPLVIVMILLAISIIACVIWNSKVANWDLVLLSFFTCAIYFGVLVFKFTDPQSHNIHLFIISTVITFVVYVYDSWLKKRGYK